VHAALYENLTFSGQMLPTRANTRPETVTEP
jgi:hypothetical protein